MEPSSDPLQRHILFVGVACSEALLREVADRYYGGRREVRPQQEFDRTLAAALATKREVTALSEPPVASFPRSSCLWFAAPTERSSHGLTIHYVTLLNLPVLKSLVVAARVFLAVARHAVPGRRRRTDVVLGNLSAYAAVPAMLAARLFGARIVAIVPDLPRLAARYEKMRNPLRQLGASALALASRLVQDRFDGYVLLAPAMNEVINPGRKPHLIVEGLLDERFVAAGRARPPKAPGKVVMYAGTLHERFGLRTLVHAFLEAELADATLWVFGNGDLLPEIKRVAEHHRNVIYGGVVGRDEAFRLQMQATLLVNPRPTADELTRYSFPSKTIEYMASGTPLLTTRLEGIPAEYGKHVFWLDRETVPGMARTISEVLKKPAAELEDYGTAARDYVIQNKMAVQQATRIVAFIDGIGPHAASAAEGTR